MGSIELSVKLRKIEEKDDMENSYAMLQISAADVRLQMFVKIGVLKNFANFTRKILR